MSKSWKGTERRIAMILSRWWTGYDKAFIRSPCSGGWPSARGNGDIVANIDDKSLPDDAKAAARMFIGTWSVDVKRRVKGSRSDEKWSLEEMLTAPKHPIVGWWLEMCDLAKTRGTYRFLVVNKATYHSYAVFGEREMLYIQGCFSTRSGITYEPHEFRRIVGPSVSISEVSPRIQEVLSIFELKSFLSKIDSRVLGGLGNASGIEDEDDTDESEDD